MILMSKIKSPSSHLIEKTAIELAACWYEVGRSQGLTSKYKNARVYAAHNLEKFLPKAIEHLINILHQPNTSELIKVEIYDALLERVGANPISDIDVNKLLSFYPLTPKREPITVIHNIVGKNA